MHWSRWSKRRRWLTLGGVAVALPIAAFAAVYLIFFQGSDLPALTLAPDSSSSLPAVSAAGVAGPWSVTSGSVAGYRVREQLAFLPAESDAVGRTSAVTGSAVLEDESGSIVLSSVQVTVDVAKLTSDQSMRDQRIRTIGLQTDTYPSASFTLQGQVAIPLDALGGATVSLDLSGSLTLHGMTRQVTIPVTARLESASRLAVAGSLTFPWSEFAMQAPDVAGFVTVESDPTMEFSLILARG